MRRLPLVERDFHGVHLQQLPTAADVAKMKAAGVGAVRFPISWQAAEQPPDVFRWDDPDAYMEAIAAAGAEPLPVLFARPGWLPTDPSEQPMSTPAGRDAWADFVTEVLHRYGPGGTFIAEHPEVPPVETWQLWNEPNLKGFWGADPDPEQYATLAEVGSAAIREADPEARIMLAGLAPAKRGLKPWQFLERTLRELDPGTFDVAAVHPYAEKLRDVRAQIADVRRELGEAGMADLPIAVTEIGWGSERRGSSALQGTPKDQARKLREMYADLAARTGLGVSQVFWYSWRDASTAVNFCGFCETSGLLRRGGKPKPALEAFAASARRLRG